MSRRLLIVAVTAAAVAAAGGGSSAGAAPRDAADPVASVKLARCSLSAHEAVFRGRMRRLQGASRMGMRFVLLERTGAPGFRPVDAPGLGRWQRSQPGVGAFAYRQTVRNLASNAAYRARVDFRWYDAAGKVTASLRRRSPVCRQFARLPNLVAALAGIFETKVPGVLRYSVRVSNVGKAAATSVPVRLIVDGDVLDTITVASLVPGDRKLVGFRGPACRRSLRSVVDPDGLITESSETDNARDSACAAPTRR